MHNSSATICTRLTIDITARGVFWRLSAKKRSFLHIFAYFARFLQEASSAYRNSCTPSHGRVMSIAILVHLPMVEFCLSQFLYISHRARGEWWSKGKWRGKGEWWSTVVKGERKRLLFYLRKDCCFDFCVVFGFYQVIGKCFKHCFKRNATPHNLEVGNAVTLT